ncbi:complexin-2 [Alkalicella caledoniensis]|uniref:Complexin-2 n=1 Tax=Alkalicella caledoniensis TaxID=2731377 RepID=A0A7G9W968_ALKCA|nr:complexin-2 [Alkalicella caledoniensis]QNO15230.1 complexin-2 [Alkalicella caledoniensis]
MMNDYLSYDLFLILVKYHLGGDDIWQKEIAEELNKKVDAIIARNTYTKYKTSPTKEEQEKARIEYLDLKGYHKDRPW